MTMTYEDATSKIANAIEIRDLNVDKNFIQSYMKGGIGRGYNSVTPLVITRKLGHSELIFNDHANKNTHFKANSAA